jgi:hypothetical protein
MKMEEYAVFMREMKRGSEILVREANGNRHFGKCKCRHNKKKRALKEHNVRVDSLACCRTQLQDVIKSKAKYICKNRWINS